MGGSVIYIMWNFIYSDLKYHGIITVKFNMQRQSIIVLIKLVSHCDEPKDVEAWGSLKEACTMHGWSYNTLSRKKLPIQHKDWLIHRVPFRALYVQEGGGEIT